MTVAEFFFSKLPAIPNVQSAIADSSGLATPPWYNFWRELRRATHGIKLSVLASEFGAVPDAGVTNNAGALQAAIQKCFDLGGGYVDLGVGNYGIATSLNMLSGVTLRGQGRGFDWFYVGQSSHGKQPTMISWYGASNGTMIFFDELVNDAGLEGLTLDMRLDAPYTSSMGDAVLIRGCLGLDFKSVNIQRCGIAIHQSATVATVLCAQCYFEDLRINSCWRGVSLAGRFAGGGGMTNSGGHNIVIWDYAESGFNFVQWTDTFAFDDVTMYGARASSIGVIFNSGDAPNPLGVTNIAFLNSRILQTSGLSGPAMLVNNTNAPGGEPGSIIFTGSINGEGPLVQHGGNLRMFMRGQPCQIPVQIPILTGRAADSANSLTYIAADAGATAHFSPQEYCTNWGADGGAYSKYFILKLEWYCRWHTGSTAGGIKLLDELGGTVAGPVEPGTVGFVTTKIDITAYMNTNWLTGAHEVFLHQKSDNVTPVNIIKSYLVATIAQGI